MSSEVKRFNPDALGDMRANLAGEYVSATDYDTVSAELREFKNGNTMSLLRAGFAKACEERDAARAQLAAIQGGMGEAVEVVAWRIEHPAKQWKVYEQRQDWAYQEYGHIKYEVQDLMPVSQHQRITAAMAAEVERLSRMLNNATNDGIKLADERDALRAECKRLAEALDRQSVITGDYIARCQRLADELAITRRVIGRIGQLCTTPHESKERFIRRVQSVIEWEAHALSAEASP